MLMHTPCRLAYLQVHNFHVCEPEKICIVSCMVQLLLLPAQCNLGFTMPCCITGITGSSLGSDWAVCHWRMTSHPQSASCGVARSMLQQGVYLKHHLEGACSWPAGEQLHAGASAGVTLRMDSQKSSKEGQVRPLAKHCSCFYCVFVCKTSDVQSMLTGRATC